jgi:hypothetical protein
MVTCYTNPSCSGIDTTCVKTLIIDLPCLRYSKLEDMLNNDTGAGHISWTGDNGEYVYASSQRIKTNKFDLCVSNALLSLNRTCEGKLQLVFRPIDCTKDMVIGDIVIRPVTPVNGTSLFFEGKFGVL